MRARLLHGGQRGQGSGSKDLETDHHSGGFPGSLSEFWPLRKEHGGGG